MFWFEQWETRRTKGTKGNKFPKDNGKKKEIRNKKENKISLSYRPNAISHLSVCQLVQVHKRARSTCRRSFSAVRKIGPAIASFRLIDRKSIKYLFITQRPTHEWACRTGAVCPAHVQAKLELGVNLSPQQHMLDKRHVLSQVRLSLTFTFLAAQLSSTKRFAIRFAAKE